MRFVPRKYQSRAIAFGLKNPVSAFLLDMGLGKTVCTLSIVAREIDECLSPGVCIVAPLKVVQQVWAQEAKLWDHTQHLKIVTVEGSAEQRAAILTEGGADIYLLSYSNLLWLADWMLQNQPPFDGVVFDESSMVKSPSSKRFKRMKPFMPFFRRRMLLTGTPASEGLINLWSQYYLLDQGERLGKYITHFKSEHYTQQDRYGYKLNLRPGHDKIIHDAVKDITLALRAEDHLQMEPVTYNVIKVPLSEKDHDRYKEFEREMFLQLGKDEAVESLNAASLSMKCRQFTSGAMYKEDGGWVQLHDAKMSALADIIDEMNGQPLLVAYEFRHEAERFAKAYPKAPIIGGGAKQAMVTKAFKDWNAKKVPLMFVHPQSVGHGVNLQYGGHTLVWFTTTWSGERYQQTVARLHRQGQKMPVIVHHLCCPGTVDSLPISAQRRKATSQKSLMVALAKYKQSPLHVSA